MIEFGGTPAISSMFLSYQANKYVKNKEKRKTNFSVLSHHSRKVGVEKK
jgi:hypothetical protein